MAVTIASISEFAQLFSEITANIVTARPVPRSLELIRQRFRAVAAVLSIENRARTGETSYVFFADAKAELGRQTLPSDPSNAQTLSDLIKRHNHLSTHFVTEQSSRYTLWIFREQNGPAFDAEDDRIAEALVCQMARSIDIAWSTGVNEVERSLYSDVLDSLNIGVMILDTAGRVVRLSPIAERFLNEREGLCLQGNKLRAISAREDKSLQESIRAAISENGSHDPKRVRGLSLTKRSGTKNLGVLVRRIDNPAKASTGQTVAVYIRDSDVTQEVEGDLVRQILDLTPAEAAVARRLTEGLSLDDAASSLAISRNTARAHLRSIFSKSGITRQTELVRLVLNSAAMLGERTRPAA